MSFNFLTLFSLILALGILVDTGIVMTEGIYNKMMNDMSPLDAALASIQEYKWPLISGTLTTVAAFLPMFFMTGILGEFVKFIPRTVVVTLLASLFVGLGILPALSTVLLKKKEKKKESILKRGINKTKESYIEVLDFFLKKKLRQWALLISMFILFLASLAFPGTGVLEIILFPDEDYRTYSISVELPEGSLLSETEAVFLEIEEELNKVPEIESLVMDMGQTGRRSQQNVGRVTVNLKEDRERSSLVIIPENRAALNKIQGATIEVEGVSGGPPTGAPIEFKLFGTDLDQLKAYSDEAKAVLEEMDGPINIRSSLDESKLEYVFDIDENAVKQDGLSSIFIAQSIRIAVSGTTVGEVSLGGDDLDVILKTDNGENIETLLSMPIQSSAGTKALSHYVSQSLEPSPTTIDRTDTQRSITVSAALSDGFNPSLKLQEFREKYNPDFDPGYSIEFGGEAEELAESFSSLGQAMVLGLFLILIILTIQFNSFRQSFVILLTIPLALIGVFSGLFILNLPFSFPAFIGVVALAGIVVNNGIILIDRVNQNAKTMTKEEAVKEAATSRFQPIVLTTLTTVAGILPLALSDPTWGPLGFAIISGLLFSSILTLLVVPSAIMLLEKQKKKTQDQ